MENLVIAFSEWWLVFSDWREKIMYGFRELEVWQKSIQLVERVYDSVSSLPQYEKYALADQLRRSAVSVPSNIAEGCSRQTTKEFIQFLYISSGSLSELETQIILIEKIYNYDVQHLYPEITSIRKMLNGLISSLKRKL